MGELAECEELPIGALDAGPVAMRKVGKGCRLTTADASRRGQRVTGDGDSDRGSNHRLSSRLPDIPPGQECVSLAALEGAERDRYEATLAVG